MKRYDLALVVGYFRTATAFLSVIRELGGTLDVAVLSVEADPAMRSKTGQAHLDFIDLCRRFGADILELGEAACATVTVFQQFPYDDELAESIQRSLRVGHRVGLLTLAMAGIAKHDAFLEQFGIQKVYVPSVRFTSFLLEERAAKRRYRDVGMVEVGLPFARYQVFPEFSTDWIIAAPTLFSFHHESGKHQFLRSVLRLLDQIPADDVVAYKSHNGNGKDYFAPRLHHALATVFAWMPGGDRLLKMARRSSAAWLRLQADRVLTCMLHRAVLRRATPMTALTPYAGISLEAFLPGVRKGVIGGLSNTIWGSLYFDLPFYNCVDEKLRQDKSELLDKRSDNLLDLNLKYFGVPFCQSDLNTDVCKLGIVQPHERHGDLVAAILDDLKHAREAQGAVA